MQKARLIDIRPPSRGSQGHHGRRQLSTAQEDHDIRATELPRPHFSRRDSTWVNPLAMNRPSSNQFALPAEVKRNRALSGQPGSSIEALIQLEENLERARIQHEKNSSIGRMSLSGEEMAAPSLRVPRSRYSRPDLCPRPLTPKKRNIDEETIQFTVNEVSSTIFELKSPTASVAPSRWTRSSFAPSIGGRSIYSRKDDELPDLPDVPDVPELPPVGTWKWRPPPMPRRPLGTFHESYSSPELSQASRRTTMRTFTQSQIFDPEYPIFSKPSFERLSLAFISNRRASKLAHAGVVNSPTNSDETLFSYYEEQRPRSAVAGSFLTEQDTLTEEPHQGKTLAAIIQELKESLKWGNHAPCTTPCGGLSPLPLCARPDGVEEFLTKMKDRSKRVWRWRWRPRRRTQAPYNV